MNHGTFAALAAGGEKAADLNKCTDASCFKPAGRITQCHYRNFDFNLSRCSFCGLCSEVCPTKPIKALIMSEDYELGSYSRASQILRIDEMYDGLPIHTYTR